MKRCKVKCSACLGRCKKYLLYHLCNKKVIRNRFPKGHCEFQWNVFQRDWESFLKENYPKHFVYCKLMELNE